MSRKPARRVVITGLGVIAPNGKGKEEFWQACVAGRSGIRQITHFDASFLPARIAGEVDDFRPGDFGLSQHEEKALDRGSQFALAAANLALRNSGLEIELARERCGVVIGTAMGPVKECEQLWRLFTEDGTHAPDYPANEAHFATMLTSLLPTTAIAASHQLHGPSTVIATGCSAGADAIGQAFWYIQEGQAEYMLAGGSDSAISPASINAFSVMRALSTRNDEPERASRPYDGLRNGFVLSEGAGVLLLEERETALRRNATIYAEILAFASNNNAHHMTALPTEGRPLQDLLNLAMEKADITPRDLGYINSHGSSTPANEPAETAAYKATFGDYAPAIPISSTKSMIGHTQGAASAIEAIVTVLALHHQILPPTINQEVPDPLCDLDYIPNVARPARFQVALTHSSGFGGVNTALVLARPEFLNEQERASTL